MLTKDEALEYQKLYNEYEKSIYAPVSNFYADRDAEVKIRDARVNRMNFLLRKSGAKSVSDMPGLIKSILSESKKMSKTVEIKITEKRLREIVAEELARKNGQKTKVVTEAIDAEGVKIVINASSKLHKALQAFKEDANTALENALGVDVDKVLSTLEHIIQNPASYTDKAKIEPKRVKLRAVKEDGLTG